MSAWIGIITLFPEMFTALNSGIPRRAQESGLIELALFNPRDFTSDKQQTVDDRPFGGGPGMVMLYQPLKEAILAAKKASPKPTKVIYLSPSGSRFDHKAASQMASVTTKLAFIFVAGRYEGIDQRLIDSMVDEEWSVGDFVTSGGELPCMVMLDSIIRQLPGALGHAQSAEQDSFENGLLDCPHYTRPEEIDGLAVPKILLSGNHQAIANWRLEQALKYTALKRPDLLEKRALSEKQQSILDKTERTPRSKSDEHK